MFPVVFSSEVGNMFPVHMVCLLFYWLLNLFREFLFDFDLFMYKNFGIFPCNLLYFPFYIGSILHIIYNIWMPSSCVLSCMATSLVFLFFSPKEKVFGLVGMLALAGVALNIFKWMFFGVFLFVLFGFF